MQAPEGT
jgi:chromosome segregation ATPase